MMKNNPEVNELIDIFKKANNEMLNKELELFIISKVSEGTLCGALILRMYETIENSRCKEYVLHIRILFAQIYESIRYIDHLGRRIPMIVKTMKELGAREPRLQEIR